MGTVRVEGLRELRTALKAVETGLPLELRKELKLLAGIVAVRAKAKIPRGPTGRVSASIRAAARGTSAIVRAGGSRAPHFGWLDFGGTIRHEGARHSHSGSHRLSRSVVADGRYLYPAAEESAPMLEVESRRMLDRLFIRAGFV